METVETAIVETVETATATIVCSMETVETAIAEIGEISEIAETRKFVTLHPVSSSGTLFVINSPSVSVRSRKGNGMYISTHIVTV